MYVIDGGNATGIIDQTTGLLEEGYAVLDRNDYGQPLIEAYFTESGTQYVYRNKNSIILHGFLVMMFQKKQNRLHTTLTRMRLLLRKRYPKVPD